MKDPGLAKYENWLENRITDKPAETRAFLRCVQETALGFLKGLEKVPKASLSLAAYVDGANGQLYRMAEALVKSAAADPDQFVYGLHQKLTEMGRYVQKNSLYAGFQELASQLSRIRINFIIQCDDTGVKVSSAYAGLMLAAAHYLSPSKYDNSRIACGCSTGGEPLYCDLYYPYAGEVQALAYRDFEEMKKKGQAYDLEKSLKKHAAEFGYTDIRTNSDIFALQDADEFRKKEILNISPYINEYTYDIIPDTGHMYRKETGAFKAIDAKMDLRETADALDARTGTLPANGIRCDFTYSPRIPEGNRLQTLTMKEILRRDRVVLLYRLRFAGQDICGYYDLKDRFFYSQFIAEEDERHGQHIDTMIYAVVLYLYRAATTPDGDRLIRDFGEHFRAAISFEGKNRYPISVTVHPLGGELMNTYEDRGEPAETPEDEDGDGEDRPKRTLQGTVRKLAPGEIPSEEDRARAADLGFALAEDEIYEEPFLG